MTSASRRCALPAIAVPRAATCVAKWTLNDATRRRRVAGAPPPVWPTSQGSASGSSAGTLRHTGSPSTAAASSHSASAQRPAACRILFKEALELLAEPVEEMADRLANVMHDVGA